MKKMFFAMLAVAVLMVSCKKDGDSSYTLEGQWLTEEEEGTDGFPSAKMLMDIGAKSGAGKMTMATLITETVGSFVEGDLYLIQEAPYTYDKSSGTLTMKHSEAGDEIAQVKFISADKVTITEDGVSIFFTRVKKEYSLKDMKSFVEFEPESDFEITPSKEADWAGGEISFVGNKEIKNLTYDAMTDGVTVSELCPTTLAEDCTLTLGLYLDSEGNIADCDILIKASDYDGNETTCIVTSDAWRPAVYTEYRGEFTEDDLSQGWSRGASCWLGALSTTDDIIIEYTGSSHTFGGISCTVPDFMVPVGDASNKVCYDTPNSNCYGTIIYTYGALTYELPIDIAR